MKTKKMKRMLFVLMLLLVVLSIPAVALAQETEPVEPLSLFLPSTLAGYFGTALVLAVTWLAGDGLAWFQATLNNLFPGIGKRLNVMISMV